MGVFAWTVDNKGNEAVDVSIVMTWKNGQGVKQDRDGGAWTESFMTESTDSGDSGVEGSGVLIHQTFNDIACTYGIAAAHKVRITVDSRYNEFPVKIST